VDEEKADGIEQIQENRLAFGSSKEEKNVRDTRQAQKNLLRRNERDFIDKPSPNGGG